MQLQHRHFGGVGDFLDASEAIIKRYDCLFAKDDGRPSYGRKKPEDEKISSACWRYMNYSCSPSDFNNGGNGSAWVIEQSRKPHKPPKRIGSQQPIGEVADARLFGNRWEYRLRLEEGDDADVEAALAGEERAWSSSRKRMRQTRSVRLLVQFGGDSRRTKKELEAVGRNIVDIASGLEGAGFAVVITAYAKSVAHDGEGYGYLTSIDLKSMSEYADYGAINYVCGDNYLLRTLVFAQWIDTSNEIGRTPLSNLGSPMPLTVEELRDTFGLEGGEVFMVPAFYSDEQAARWKRETLEKLNGLY